MADADSDGHELNFSVQKNPTREALKGKRKAGRNDTVEKEGLKKRGMSTPGRAVVVSGTSMELPYDDMPVDLSSDDKDLVMEYPDMFDPSKDAGIIDIQEGDAISESSDTEIVAHTNEQIQYDNQASSSESNSDNDDDDDDYANDGPPPLNSDEGEDDDDNIDGPPPLDSDDNGDDTDDGEDLPVSPETGSREELNTRRGATSHKSRGSQGFDSDSDSDGGVKEAPPPLDSEEEDNEIEASNSCVENSNSGVIETTIDNAHDSTAEDVDNGGDEEHDNDDDEGYNDNEKDQANDNEDEKEHEYSDVSDDDECGGNVDDNEEEVENPQVVLHSSEAITHETENSDESEQSDSPAEAEGQIPVEDECNDQDDQGSDQEDGMDSGEETHVPPVACVEVSSAMLSGDNSQGDDHKGDEETDVNNAAVNDELNEQQSTVISDGHQTVRARKEKSEVESDQDSQESPEFVPDDDENELEWDVEDFDMPKHKNTKRTKPASKIDPEGEEVKKLKKSFLDTLRSEAEQTEVVESGKKIEAKKKEKSVERLNAKRTQAKEEEKKQVKDSSKNVSVQELKSAPGSARRATKDTIPEREQVKVEKKTVKDGVKSAPKNGTPPKRVDGTTKLSKTNSKSTDSSLEKADKQKTEKQRRAVKESPKSVQDSERKVAAKSTKVKSTSASSVPTNTNEHKRSQLRVATREKKNTRPTSDVQADFGSHKEETGQKKRQEWRVQKSDSDAALDSYTKQKSLKAVSSESVSKQKKSSTAVSARHDEKEKSADRTEIKQSKTKQTASKSAVSGTDHKDGHNHENKRRRDVSTKNANDAKSKPKARPTSNGHLSSSQEKLSLHSGRHGHAGRDHGAHRSGGHAHDRGKHVWLCRDDEIHKLIAQKASLLKEYESGSLAGRKVFSGHKSRFKREDDPADIPDVGFVSNKQSRRHQVRPLSEVIPDKAPYSSQCRDKRRSLPLRYSGSSSDDDERTNRAVGAKKGGTFAVGLAARNIEHKEGGASESDHEETCEYCAAEKMSWDEYVKSCKRAVTQRQQPDQSPPPDPRALPVELLQTFRLPGPCFDSAAAAKARDRNPAWEGPHHPRNLLLGVVYSAKYLGSSQIMSPQSPNKAVRMEQAQEAVGRIKVPEGEDQPTTDVDLFISTERLKIVNSSTKEVMLDHVLRTVSFIADIGDVLVLMVRQPPEEHTSQVALKPSQILASVGTAQTDHKTIKITCHVFQSPEAQVIAKSIGQAFNVAYQEFLRQNGLSDEVVEEAEYNGVLEAQKILGEDLSLLADANSSKEVIVNKKPHEHLGVMIVESGWGSMIPCAIIAHLAKDGPAAKSGRLNVGDQILSVNGTSLVGLPLLECQNIIKSIRPNTKVVLKIVSCPPTVQVVVNRPDTKYQLGFSVQNGMICSLMRGSIAERGGVRVGHRIIEINNESVVATSHQHIVELLASTVGEIRMKTMPASMYRLLVGLDTPQHI